MMKAFSFLTILESLSKKLSILRTKMHSDNLRVDYESITSQLRVNPLFSHCAASGASFGTSRRVSHFAAILTILFTIGVGSVWGEEVLFSTDFSDSKWSGIESICNSKNAPDETHNGITFHSYNSSAKPFKIDQSAGTMTWCENNMDSKYWIAIPITGVNGSITITVGNGNKTTSFKYVIKEETTISGSGGSGSSEDITAAAPCVFTKEGLNEKNYVVYLGRNSSNYKTIKSIRITTPTPCDGINPSLTYSKTTLQVGEQLDPIFNSDGSTGAVTYESNNTAAVTVDANGKITAVGVGMATIKASVAAANGKCAGEATVNILVQGTTGQHTLTWDLNVVAGSSESNETTTDIGTASKQSSSIYLTDLTNLTGVGVNRTSSGKNDNTGKIETPAAYDASKYVSMTFKVADGYGFTPSSVSIKTVAVTTTKDLIFEISDANGSYSVTKTNLSTSATAFTNELDFSGCDVTFTGTVTVKIYVYGANDTYRLSTPLTIDGTVEEALPSCTAPTLSYATTAVTKTFGDAAFTNTLTNTNGVAVAYSSSDESVATIADNGQVTIVGAGQTTITASSAEQTVSGTLYCEAEASYTLTVNQANISPTLTYNPNSLAIGGTANPTINGNTGNGTVTYSSSNTSVATVNQNGVVTAVAEGTATITATIAASDNYNGGTATCQISVHCTAPNHVDISGRWDRFGGETISLTATAYSSAGTGSSIADGDITGWQWEKLIGSTWTALSNGTVDGVTTSGATTKNLQIANCGAGNSGKYRCVVSTGATCSTASATATDGKEGFGVKVYVLECYTGGKTEHHFTRTGDSQAGTLTMNLTANTTYEFKVHVDNDYYGNNGTIYENATNWVCATTQASNLKVFSGYGGTFTFKVDYSVDGNSNVEGEPEVSVTYPEDKTIYVIPNGYTGDNAKLAIYYWNDGTSGWSSFLTKDACSGDAYYAEIPSWTGKISIVRLNSDATVGDFGKKWNQTVDIIIDPTKDQYTINTWCGNGCKETVNEGTYTPATYSITFNANGGDGTMSAMTGITCGGSATLTQNAFTRTGYNFAGWATAANGTGTSYADKATISNIISNITLYAKWNCTAPTNVAISGEYVHFPGETLTLTVSGDNIANNATYTWKKGDQVIAGQTTATLTINEATIENAGNYTCTISNGGSCEATANFTIKMYSLRGLIDWSTDCSFTKVNATTATYSMELAGSSSYEFKIFDGSVYYGNEGANPTMTSTNCTNWTMKENSGNNVTLQTTASGTYTFTLDYSDASNLKISVTYPAKRIVYLNPNIWASDNPKFAVHAWHGSTTEDILMTKIDDCDDRNIYFAEIDATHTHVIFIRGNKDTYNITNPWQNVWNQTVDLQLIAQDLFTVNEWGDGKSNGEWTSFTPNYTVTFDANGHGTAPEAQCVAKNGKATTPSAPTATGYTFDGWYKEAGCTNAWDFANGVVTSDITLYAKWTVNSYTVTWNPAGGNWGGNTDNIVQTYEYGAKINAPEKPSRTGYEFAEWDPTYDANATTMPANNVTYTAKWTPETYYINYYEAVGEVNDISGLNQISIVGAPTSYTILDAVALPALPAKDGYTATGWYSQWCVFENQENTQYWAGCTPTTGHNAGYYGHANYIVKYTANTYTITWNANGGNVTPANSTYTYGGSTVTLPTPTRDSYTFNGWFTEESGGTQITEIGTTNKPTSDVIYYAQWTENATPDPEPEQQCVALIESTITGASAADKTGMWASDATVTASVQDKGNGTTGWKLGSDGNYFRISLTENTFKEGDIVTIMIGTGGDASKQLAIYSDNGSTLIGEKQSGVQQGANEIRLTTDSKVINLYRNTTLGSNMNPWVISMSVKRCGIPHTVTLNTNEGTINAGNITSYIEGVGATLPTNVTKIGYTFGGWYESADFQGDAVTTISTTATGDKTYWAKWEERELGEGCFWANSETLTSNSVTLADGTEVALEGCTRDADGISIGGNMLFTAPTGRYFESFSFVATCGSDGKDNYYKINGDDQQTLALSTKAEQTYTITIPAGTNASTIQIIKNGTTPKVSQICYTFKTTCTEPTITFNNGSYTVGGSALDLSTLFTSNSAGAVTYTVTNANGTGATINGTSFSATAAGTATVTATQAANGSHCEKAVTATITVTAASVDPDPEPGTETCITLGSDNSKDIKTDGTATVGNYTITASGINWQSTSAKIDNDNDYIIITNSTGITAANVTAKSNILFVTYSSSIDGTESKTTEEVTATNNFTELTLDVPNGTKYIKLQRENGGSSIYVSEICLTEGSPLPSCTTPVLSNLENQKVCPGSDVTWTANNTAELADGETIAYQWNKKGNNTVLSNSATLTLDNVTEATGGTYVVTATVSADGKASATATKEVTLTVTPATATPTITASANTIFAGNSVTLTATCASSGVTYQWYTCNDAEGNGESAIGAATNTTYTLTAGEAGTYYYKVIVTGDGTHSCGTAEKVYELVVKTPSAGCYDMIIFDSSEDQTIPAENAAGTEANTGASWANVGTSESNSSCNYTYGSKTYKKGWKFVGGTTKADSRYIQFEIPSGYVGSLFMAGYITSTDRSVFISDNPTGSLVTKYAYIKPSATNVLGTASVDLPTGTYYVCATDAFLLTELSIEICSDVNCTDPQVTATVDNATICAGTENVTFTATNYADGATLQWQKKDGNTWTNINGAISATYTISSVTTAHAGQYRVIAEKGCKRISEEVTLTVLTAPTFNTFATTASVMKGNALAISDVQATGATGYAWYKSTDNSFDAAEDTKVGTSNDLLLAAASIPEAADQTFYLFCVASNSCGSTESQAITVTVTPFIAEECATKGNEGDNEFGFTNTDCGQETYESRSAWKSNGSSKYLTYTAPAGRYFATAKVTIAHTKANNAVYGYSTDGGTTWTYVEFNGLSTAYTTITIELPKDVNAFRIGRNMDGKGESSGSFYLAEACFTYENACTETTLIVGSYNNEYNISTHMEFVEPTFTLKAGETTLEGQTLTYTSSNRAIATVDEDGNVTFEGMTGTVTITATFAGGEISETEYCACQATYTITVGCADQAPKIVAAAGTNLNGCNNSITLEAKMQDGTTAFADGTFQWYRDGEAIEGATSASYEVVRAGTYTVSRTYTCTTMSSNSAVVTNENVEPEVERLTPFQYYHVDKTYSNQMKGRHLFAVTSYGTLNGKRYHLTATRNGETLDLSSSTAFFTIPSSDNAVDTVMIDLNELKGKYSANDEIVITCAPINSCNNASAITASITIHVIDKTPVLALICSGAKADGTGTRVTAELTVGGDFLTGYNPADLCQQTSNTTFDPNTEWGFYTELKKNYIVVPVNGYAQFNKLNYEPFDVLLLTDYPKSSHSEAAQKIIDDMAELCDYRPLLSFKTHFQSANWAVNGEYKYNKWTKKGFVTAPVVPATTGTYVNIVCYAHPMFEEIQAVQGSGSIAFHDYDDHNQLVYEMLTGPGHESGKGIQGFELADANSFVTIGLVHYNATAIKKEVEEGGEDHEGDGEGHHTHVQWTSGEDDRLLVAIAERQTNIEARMILFSINCGAQSLQTEGGRQVILECLKYLYDPDNDNPSLIEVADCYLTFDNGAGNIDFDEAHYREHGGTGTKGDGLWTTAANWAPKYDFYPSANNEVRIAAPCTIDIPNAAAFSVQIVEEGKITINTGKALTVRSTITRYDKDNATISPTESEDIFIGSTETGNGTLIFNNDAGDTKATVEMYSTAKADTDTYSAAKSTWQYIGTPHSDVQNAANNYYESWLYQYNSTGESWDVIPNGGPLVPFRGYCITHPEKPHTYTMTGTLTATTSHSAEIPAGKYVVIANSWTAPIQIANFEDDDLENLTDKAVYLFNTGSDPEGDGTITPDASATQETRYAAGTYISIPIHSAPYTGDATISSMQGFYVVGGTSDGAVHLDYDKLVRPKEGQSIVGPPMHAPKRIAAQEQSPIVLKMIARGSRYDDNLFVLEREDFTRGYDSGWDGEEWGGSDVAPILYTTNENFIDQTVCAIPDMEGTLITFRAGEDNEYTFHFDYNEMAEALYLLDIDTQIYTRVLKGNSYTFTCADKAAHSRFILTRKAPQIATGTDHINTGENAKAVKFIKDDKIFIFVNGMLYDATGKMVIR